MTKEMLKYRIKVLNMIFSNFQQITQWIPSEIDIAHRYMLKAKGLIEMLEVGDCGSIGGYDRDNNVIFDSGFRLYGRFLALVRKYKNEKDIKRQCYFDLENLKKYFIKLSKLREEFNK